VIKSWHKKTGEWLIMSAVALNTTQSLNNHFNTYRSAQWDTIARANPILDRVAKVLGDKLTQCDLSSSCLQDAMSRKSPCIATCLKGEGAKITVDKNEFTLATSFSSKSVDSCSVFLQLVPNFKKDLVNMIFKTDCNKDRLEVSYNAELKKPLADVQMNREGTLDKTPLKGEGIKIIEDAFKHYKEKLDGTPTPSPTPSPTPAPPTPGTSSQTESLRVWLTGGVLFCVVAALAKLYAMHKARKAQAQNLNRQGQLRA
jgi:hypothetical protein